MTQQNNTLVQYIRNKDKEKIGIIAAFKISDDKFALGWSQAAILRGEKFNKEMGLKIAIGRAVNGWSPNAYKKACKTSPIDLPDELKKMSVRASKYFKGCVSTY